MKVFNKTRNIYLSLDVKKATSFSDKLFGLLKKSNLESSMLFKTRFGIHTFLLKFPIDVIILDDDGKIVKLTSVLPNKLFFWNPKFSQVLELPFGCLTKTNTQIGDNLLFRS